MTQVSADRRPITVIKRNPQGEETWRYQGILLQKEDHRLVLEAIFDRNDGWVGEMHLHRGDRFVETWYTDRWYNIFEVHARQDDHLRGWYCNIGCPAEIDSDTVSYIDLALDLLVYPDGRMQVLDEDEFADLDIDEHTREGARRALKELIQDFKQQIHPGK